MPKAARGGPRFHPVGAEAVQSDLLKVAVQTLNPVGEGLVAGAAGAEVCDQTAQPGIVFLLTQKLHLGGIEILRVPDPQQAWHVMITGQEEGGHANAFFHAMVGDPVVFAQDKGLHLKGLGRGLRRCPEGFKIRILRREKKVEIRTKNGLLHGESSFPQKLAIDRFVPS